MARTFAFYAEHGCRFEWKTFEHGRADLLPLLVRHGAVPEPREALVLGGPAHRPRTRRGPGGRGRGPGGQRGWSILQVDASDDSRPILERLGLHVVGATVPYETTPEQ